MPSSAISVSSIAVWSAAVPRSAAGDLAVDVADGLQDALAGVALLVAVAQLERFARAGRGARRHGRPAARAGLERDFDFDGGIAAGIENLASQQVSDAQ